MGRIVNLDLDEDFLNKFFDLTDAAPPQNITIVELKKQVSAIDDTLSKLNKQVQKYKFSAKTSEENSNTNFSQAILIVDDLGIITYQLKVLLSKLGFDIETSQEVFDAITKFKKRHFKFVVMDLFIPTDREGFILLDELKKASDEMNVGTIIGIITASAKKEHPALCKKHGADFFIEKIDDWQTILYNKIKEIVDSSKEETTTSSASTGE